MPRATRRTLLIATGATVLTVGSALWRAPSVEALGAPGTGGAVASALHLSAAYLILSPLCEGYDALTLLTLSQHAAILAWLVALFAVFRIFRRRAPASGGVTRRGLRREAMLLGAAILAFAGVYVLGAIVPRPMAALALDDPDEIAVDIHSHTSASHDGRLGFDAAANRRWHSAAGFGAAYITDHRRFDGAEAGERGNPARAGDGTVLLSGIESFAPHSHITILGARRGMGVDMDGHVDSARLARLPGLVAVLTTPASLAWIPVSLRLDAVEISDGAPRGLSFTRRLAPEIEQFATTRQLALVAGSDNHGWGRTAAAWTILRLPGWRAMSPDSLDRAIRATLIPGGNAVRVIGRTSTPLPRSLAAVVATPALLLWGVVTRLSGAERVSWTVWIWSLAALLLWRGRNRQSDASDDDGDDAPLFRGELPNGDESAAEPPLSRRTPGRRAAY